MLCAAAFRLYKQIGDKSVYHEMTHAAMLLLNYTIILGTGASCSLYRRSTDNHHQIISYIVNDRLIWMSK